MSKEIIYTCDRCERRVEVPEEEAYHIPSNFVRGRLSAYDYNEAVHADISVQVCKPCFIMLQRVFRSAMKARG